MKVTFEGLVKRIYSETRGQYTSTYVVVCDGAVNHPDTFRFKMKNGVQPSCAEGDKVKVSAYIHGREWTPQDGGEPRYFTDLNVDTIDVAQTAFTAAPAAAPATPAAKPTTASNWNELLALGTAYGEDATAVTNRCKATHPGKASNTYTAADWQAVAAAIVSAHTPPPPPPAAFASDMPF